MLKLERIICPVDFSEFSARAYRYGLSVAEHYGAKLVVQHVVELWRYPSAGFAASAALYDEFCQSVCEGAKEQLREFVKHNTRDGIQPEFVVHEGMAPDAILSFAQALKADGIVMGTHGQRGFDRLMLGSVTDRVMRKASCPVLVVRNAPRDLMATDKEGRHVHRLRQILFCTDFSENSERALSWAISATEEYDAELTLLHVLEEASSPAKTEKAIAAATEQLDKLIPPESRKALKAKTVVRVGKPYRQIIQFAEEEQVDMVAMGVRGRGTLDLAVFGSTTYRLMQLGPCPVLAVQV
jgi:nucleotide-binding universal stress UspA family protein